MAKWDLDKVDSWDTRYILKKLDVALSQDNLEKSVENLRLELIRHLAGQQFKDYLNERIKDEQ